jgi:fructose-1,6-bisphosphatase/inositol monophosphatase family enzyme
VDKTEKPLDERSVLSDLHDAVDSVFLALENHDDWGLSGKRPDQYLSDLVADAAIHESLKPLGYGILSEESEILTVENELFPTIVVDPLDGSTNASRGLPWFATSLCAVDGEGPWVAVVADLVSGTRYDAVRGWGARRDGEEIKRDSCPALNESIVAVSGLPEKDLGWEQFRNLGSAALALCSIADGQLDAFVDCTPDAHGVWDYLGGMLICQEAGGVVYEVKGRELCVLDREERRTPVAAAGKKLGDELLAQRQTFEVDN